MAVQTGQGHTPHENEGRAARSGRGAGRRSSARGHHARAASFGSSEFVAFALFKQRCIWGHLASVAEGATFVFIDADMTFLNDPRVALPMGVDVSARQAPCPCTM